ncbi:MAG: glycosyltransferase family 2 protein [Desulfobaccales bacterium]
MSPGITISIALCTYNGEQFLPEQLNSFLAQTRQPDELVVCDDGSTDQTMEILEKFKRKAPFPVSLYINEQNLGFRRNFEKAMSLCQGNLIAFSDQDDIWLPEKLKAVEQIFEKYPSAGYAFHDAFLVDEEMNWLGLSLWDKYNFSFQLKNHFNPGEFVKYYMCLGQTILGATITMNAKLREYLLPLPDHWAHDSWIAFAGSLNMEVIALSKKLNKYRQHSHQLFGVSTSLLGRYKQAKKADNSIFKGQAIGWKEAMTRLSSDIRLTCDKDILRQVSNKINHLEVRGNLTGSILHKLPIIVKEIKNRRYHRYSNGWKSAIRDLLLA